MTAGGALNGCVNLEWAVDAIIVGARHRQDLGDLDGLVESIRERGLLQPVTITPDGVLICGARRLAALKRLGHKRTPVWVRSGLSDRLSSLMAERDENTARAPYSKVELAALYEELKREIAADAARRKQAHQFGADTRDPSSDGSANLAEPWRGKTDSRRQAAAMLGVGGHVTLEKVLAIQEMADDQTRPEGLRAEARRAVEEIDQGGPVDPLFNRLRSLVRIDDLDRIAADPGQPDPARQAAREGALLLRRLEDNPAMTGHELDQAARAALARVQRSQGRRQPAKPRPPKPGQEPDGRPRRALKSAKSFVWTWTEMAAWPDEYDPAAIAQALTEDQYQRFLKTMDAANQFTAELTRHRRQQHVETAA
ncbi:MAG: ParB N-terminal domain-containing protein [Bifidobacteriaceae bacterium]|jgi:ParB family chromosome partitioning protein|nr:ParB N-terminal domain-containing protein [Bifidobacteriaceae bacterium]